MLKKEIYWKITWPSQWFALFAWKNENWKSWKTCKNLHDKKEYVIAIGNLKQTLNHGLVMKKVYRVIKFNQKIWLIWSFLYTNCKH